MRLTDEDKQQIAEMRLAGKSYQKIADELGHSKNTVKSYLKRHGIEKSTLVGNEDLMYIYCLQCGAKLQQREKTKPKKFCNDACRMAWWSAHQDRLNRKTIMRTCIHCGKEFKVNESSSKKYCSSECYFKDRFKDHTPKAQKANCSTVSGREKCTALPDGCLCYSCAWFYDGERHCTGCQMADENL